MQAFTTLNGVVAPIDRANVDTDAIIPKQFLKSIKRTGFGPNLFDEWRYLDHGEPGQDNTRRAINPDFVLNHERYRDTRVLLARENFGCGSSREHAPWALLDFGISCVIAPSFADIFFNNSCKNGLLPVVLDAQIVEHLFEEVETHTDYRLQIDLEAQTVTTPTGNAHGFEIDPFRKFCLLNGLDEVGLTMQYANEIRSFEARRRRNAPWLFEPTDV